MVDEGELEGAEAQKRRAKELAVARAEWPDGPWNHEGDRKEWKTRAGLPGLIVRNHMGVLCGYAAVPPGHPAHGKPDGEVDVSVHGGLTYADRCGGPICHVPAPGEPADVWWFGFDCAHAFDLTPAFLAMRSRHGILDNIPGTCGMSDTYRDLAYVTGEVEDLAEQLAAMGVG